MFNPYFTLRWLAATLIAGALLLLIPFSQREVANQRLEEELTRATEIQKLIASTCSELTSNDNTPLERWFIGKLFTSPTTLKDQNLVPCVLGAKSVNSSRFYLWAQWGLGIEVMKGKANEPFINHLFSTEFPLPLCFLPLLVFLLLIPFTNSAKEALFGLMLHFLFLGGLNLIKFIKILPRSGLNILLNDRFFLGLLLFSFWLSLRSSEDRKRARFASNPTEAAVNSFLSNLVGIWNPLLYTLTGPILFSLGSQLKNLKPFFNSQWVILSLSLYVFGLDLSNIYSVFSTFLTPRYFSFAILFCFSSCLIPKFPGNQPLIWELKNFWRYFIIVLLLGSLGFFMPEFRTIPTLTRIALLFLLVDFTKFELDPWALIIKRWKGPLVALIISSFAATLSHDLGGLDLIISILDPKKHPTAVLPFTLMSGFFISFVSGGLASPFFILVSQTIQTYPEPLIRAALFDGVLAGLLLSPFSLFNLYPAVQHNIPIQKILKLRIKQSVVPLFIGSITYLVGTITRLGILPPVSFVFCCLIVITFKLKKNQWKISRFGLIEHSDPH